MYRFPLLILVGLLLIFASSGQDWDFYEAIERGKVRYENGLYPKLTEDDWASNLSFGNTNRYTLPNSMRSIYFIDSTYIDVAYVLESKMSGIRYCIIEDTTNNKLDSLIEEVDLIDLPNVFVDITDYWYLYTPTRIFAALFMACDGPVDQYRYKSTKCEFRHFNKYIFNPKPCFYYVCLISGFALESSFELQHVEFINPQEPYQKPQFLNSNFYYRAVIAV